MDELVAKLDPSRDYGERTYDEVVAGIEEGSIAIAPGRSLPLLYDTSNGYRIKGSGQPPKGDLVEWSHQQFRELAAADLHKVYGYLIRDIEKGDTRATKLFLEYLIGRAPQSSINVDDMAQLFELMRSAAQTPQVSTLTYETYNVLPGPGEKEITDGAG